MGNILGRKGAQSRRQRENSISMKEHFDRDTAELVRLIMHDEHESTDEALPRAMACLAVALGVGSGGDVAQKHSKYTRYTLNPLSFKYVAAAVCLREIDKLRL